MVSFRILIAILFTLILGLVCSIEAQTIHYFTGDSVPCYTAICSHPKTFRDTIAPPFDGCIGFDQAAPGWGSLVLVIGNSVVLDTCILTAGTGIPTQVCWSATDTVKVFYFGPDSTAVGVWRFPGSGHHPLSNIVSSLCPLLVSTDRPHPPASPREGYTDMTGRHWLEQPKGVSFSWVLGRKVLRIE